MHRQREKEGTSRALNESQGVKALEICVCVYAVSTVYHHNVLFFSFILENKRGDEGGFSLLATNGYVGYVGAKCNFRGAKNRSTTT